MPHIDERESLDNRQRLIQAAVEVFREEGYRASIDRIVARAGVVKQTLYNHFRCKNDLFREAVQFAGQDFVNLLEEDGRPLREHLIAFATVLRARLIGTEGISWCRIMEVEASRFPELAQSFFEQGPGRALDRLAKVLERAMFRNELRTDDPVFAAEMLLSMLTGFDRTRRLFGAPMLSEDAEQARVARIVDCYIAAYTL